MSRRQSVQSRPRRSPSPGNTDVVGARIAAQIIDMIAIFVIMLVVGVAVAGAFRSRGAVFLVFIAVSLGYGTVLEGVYGKTLGKMALGVRVVGRSGEDIGFGAALVRNVPALFGGWLTWLVGMAAIAVDDQNQRLFDQLADTYVVGG